MSIFELPKHAFHIHTLNKCYLCPSFCSGYQTLVSSLTLFFFYTPYSLSKYWLSFHFIYINTYTQCNYLSLPIWSNMTNVSHLDYSIVSQSFCFCSWSLKNCSQNSIKSDSFKHVSFHYSLAEYSSFTPTFPARPYTTWPYFPHSLFFLVHSRTQGLFAIPLT